MLRMNHGECAWSVTTPYISREYLGVKNSVLKIAKIHGFCESSRKKSLFIQVN